MEGWFGDPFKLPEQPAFNVFWRDGRRFCEIDITQLYSFGVERDLMGRTYSISLSNPLLPHSQSDFDHIYDKVEPNGTDED